MSRSEVKKVLEGKNITNRDFEKYNKTGFPDYGANDQLSYELQGGGKNSGQTLLEKSEKMESVWNLLYEYVSGNKKS